jgi:membrane protein YqaA with SNARE-associated domain
MRRVLKRLLVFLAIVALVLVLTAPLYFFSPEEVVDMFGVRNSLIVLFVVSFFGGLSAGGAASFMAVLGVLAASGINPFMLGAISGLALTIGDLLIFGLGKKGREMIEGKTEERLERFSRFLQRKSGRYIPFVIWFYIGLTPFPNDLLTISLAAIDYPKKKIWLPVLLGDLTFATLFAVLVSYGVMVV